MLDFRNQKPKADLFWALACDKLARTRDPKTHETQPLPSGPQRFVGRWGDSAWAERGGPWPAALTEARGPPRSLGGGEPGRIQGGDFWAETWRLSRRRGAITAMGVHEWGVVLVQTKDCVHLSAPLTPAGTPIPTALYSANQMKVTPRPFLDCLFE